MENIKFKKFYEIVENKVFNNEHSLPRLFNSDRSFVKYSKEELSYILNLNNLGISYKVIAKSIMRTENAVKAQCLKLRKENGTYNKKHLDEKYKLNNKFLCHLFLTNRHPKSILDAYSGYKPYWTNYEQSLGIKVITNDINKNFPSNYHMNASELIKKLREEGKRFDIVDLDPFSSPVECFQDAIHICEKGLIMTFGDKRGVMSNKNLAKERYNCKIYDETLIIRHFQRMAKKHNITLKLFKLIKWKMTWRVYFTVHKDSTPYKCNNV